ncbi:MAG: hypothetical protein GY717_02060 [Rhodobacteraceae bacterium]|nr:hypothetical protein [Paracoccaceae bacterium]
MQIEITLTAPQDADYAATDLGFLLHKHPDHLHIRSTSAGETSIFFLAKVPGTHHGGDASRCRPRRLGARQEPAERRAVGAICE